MGMFLVFPTPVTGDVVRKSLFTLIPAAFLLLFSQSLLAWPVFLGTLYEDQHQSSSRTNTNPQLLADAQSVLGKINYSRAREITLRLQHTLRTIKNYEQGLRLADNPAKRDQLQKQINEEITTGVSETQELLGLLQDSGFENLIFEHKKALAEDFSHSSIAPYERDIFKSAGFSDHDFDDFATFFNEHGYEVLTSMQQKGRLSGLRDRLRTQAASGGSQRYRKIGIYIKIFGGGIAIGGDLLIGALVGTAIPPAGAVGIVGSTSAGVAYIGDSIIKLGEVSSQ